MKKIGKIGKIKTVSFHGINAFETTVEVSIIAGIPSFTIVGLGDKTINESRERVRSALMMSEFSFPIGKIIVNLSPANKYKEGSHYDLPIALAILQSCGELNVSENIIAIGELSLNGELNAIKGVLPSAIFASKNQFKIICSHNNIAELKLISNLEFLTAKSLKDMVYILKNPQEYKEPFYEFPIFENKNSVNILKHIKGQHIAKRALIVAAAGFHNLLFIGAHGVGKSTLAKSITYLLPDLTYNESLEVTSIFSMVKEINSVIKKPTFRSPHSSSSLVSLVGGGSNAHPGEISFAHRGVLFLDEFSEFNSFTLEALRAPMEDGYINISRSNYRLQYPARFQLLAAMNPCKCGNLLSGRCGCRKNNLNKISSPIQDRIAIKVVLDNVNFDDTIDDQQNYDEFIEKINNCKNLQYERWRSFNSQVNSEILEENFTENQQNIIKKYITEKKISMRSYKNILCLSQTIADLYNEKITNEYIYEAIFLNNSEIFKNNN
jgi:magnesium chelatase family protein